ncbi:pentapeptide repeat-containing protein, partial [Taylorella equigenitalis]
DESNLRETRFHRALTEQSDLKTAPGAIEKDVALFEAELWSEQFRTNSPNTTQVSDTKGPLS